MTLHFHIKDRPITVRSGCNGFTTGFGLRRVKACERCGFTTDEFYELEGVFMCDNCYTEIMVRVDNALSGAFCYD